MLGRRTDLALEAKEIWEEGAAEAAVLEGVEAAAGEREGFPTETVHILDRRGEEALGKPVGRYVTLTLDGLARREEGAFGRAARAVAGELAGLLEGVPAGGLALVGYQGAAYLLARRRLLRGAQPGTEEERAQLAALAAELGALLGLEPGAPALVVGLGNRAITPDNIGPKAADQTMVTRHLVERVPEHFGSFRPVAALAAGVLGTTGMESGELVRAVAETLRPACVIAVDALASRSLRRVCRTIQLSDTGITPGSGVGNARAALNAETLGVPVIAVGVPTVVDAATLTCDVLAEAGKGELNPAALQGAGDGLIVTPKDIDTQVHDLAKVIGYGINLALHTGLTIEDVELFLS